MHSPALAIGWSIWARHRVGNVALLAGIPVCAVLYRIFQTLIPISGTEPRDFLHELPLTILPMALSMVWVLYICGQTESDPRKGFTGFPMRMFTLPLRTSFLVACHMAIGVVAILLVHLAWARLVFAPVGVHLVMRWPLLLSAMAMISFQAVVWGLASFPWIRAIFICIGGLVVSPLLAVASVPDFDWHQHEPFYAICTLAALPVVCGLALAAVTAERRGGWAPWGPVRRLAHRIFDSLLLRQQPFASSTQALAWLEWRRKGFLLVPALAASIAGSVCMLPVMAALNLGSVPLWFPVALAFFWPVFMGGIMGGLLAKPDFGGEAALTPFHAIKPMTNGQIVFVKLGVAAGVTLAGWVLSVPLAWALTLWPKWRELWISGDLLALTRWWTESTPGTWGLTAAAVIVAMVLTWFAMVTSLSPGLTGNARRITLLSAFGLVSLSAALSIGTWLVRRPDLLALARPWLYVGVALLMAFKFFSFLQSFAVVRRRALVSSEQLRLLLALWFVVALSLLGGTALIWLKLPVPKTLVLVAVAWFWPAGELAQCILNLADNRHR